MPRSPGGLSPEGETIERYRAFGQEQVFRFFDRLSATERAVLLRQAASLDLELVARLSRAILSGPAPRRRIAPLDPVVPDAAEAREARARGRALFREGRVALYTVAGGQGTRLGFDGPKGDFPIGPFSGKTLFAWHAETVLAASRRAGRPVPWVLLVSETNAEETRRIFAAADWYGLRGQVRFVTQRMLPAVDGEGKILLQAPGRILLAPNGHGGAIEALARDGLLDRLRSEGVEYVSYFQVDNPLLDAADPAFLGLQALRGAEMTAKVVAKSHAHEKAGVLVLADGRPGVVEYSELTDADAEARGPDGELLYRYASIAAHGISAAFLARMSGEGLPYHGAVKKVPTVTEDGAPMEAVGHKFEMFVFDAIPLARNFFPYLVDRREEFAPLKNDEGADSPATVRAALLARSRGWFERAGRPLPAREEELEVSPLVAPDFETFASLRGPVPGGPGA